MTLMITVSTKTTSPDPLAKKLTFWVCSKLKSVCCVLWLFSCVVCTQSSRHSRRKIEGWNSGSKSFWATALISWSASQCLRLNSSHSIMSDWIVSLVASWLAPWQLVFALAFSLFLFLSLDSATVNVLRLFFFLLELLQNSSHDSAAGDASVQSFVVLQFFCDFFTIVFGWMSCSAFFSDVKFLSHRSRCGNSNF